MNRIYDGIYWKIYWLEEGIMKMVFLPTTAQMTNESYLAELRKYITLIKGLRPSKILADTREFRFTIIPEIQDWLNEHLFSVYARFLKKHAILTSHDFFAQVSIEQAIDEIEHEHLLTRYFESEHEAKTWLMADAHGLQMRQAA